jgi:hypothetical protein
MENIKTQQEAILSIYEYAINQLKEGKGEDIQGSELHNEIFNTDYFIIGTYKAKQFLNAYGVFEAIEKVMEYEKFNFGEVLTEIHNPERLVNMLAYVEGEEILSESETLTEFWDTYLESEQIEQIIKELEK